MLSRMLEEAIGLEEAGGPTFKAAQQAVMNYLQQQGWKVVSGLKVPHATSPDGAVRLWFKAQAVYYTHGNSHTLGGARTLTYDTNEIKRKSPEQFVKDAEARARMDESIEEGFGGYGRRSYGGDPRWMKAKYAGIDNKGRQFKKGDDVLYWPSTKTFMTGKEADEAWQDFLSNKGDEEGMPYAR